MKNAFLVMFLGLFLYLLPTAGADDSSTELKESSALTEKVYQKNVEFWQLQKIIYPNYQTGIESLQYAQNMKALDYRPFENKTLSLSRLFATISVVETGRKMLRALLPLIVREAVVIEPNDSTLCSITSSNHVLPSLWFDFYGAKEQNNANGVLCLSLDLPFKEIMHRFVHEANHAAAVLTINQYGKVRETELGEDFTYYNKLEPSKARILKTDHEFNLATWEGKAFKAQRTYLDEMAAIFPEWKDEGNKVPKNSDELKELLIDPEKYNLSEDAVKYYFRTNSDW